MYWPGMDIVPLPFSLLLSTPGHLVKPLYLFGPFWTFLLLPLLLTAPVQLSLTAGVACTYCWFVSGVITVPLPLLDAGACVGTGRHMGSATVSVSVFIKWMIIAAALTGLLQTEGDGADGWRHLSTPGRIIPLLVVKLPPETGGGGAIGATAAPLVFF